jgi:very-short-patch-repair endonuclease
VAADAALRTGLCTRASMQQAAAPFRGRPTYARIGRALDFATDRSASPGESVARTMFAEQGLPAPSLARPIVVDGHVIAEVDFLWEDLRTIGEFDGRLKYRPDNDRGDDVLWQEKLREERLREAGYEVVRMTWAQVTGEPRRTADRVRQAFARKWRADMAG